METVPTTATKPPPPCMIGTGNAPRLRDRLLVFFALNDEQLTLGDVCIKFGVHRSTAQQSLMNMREAGLVEAVNKPSRTAPLIVGRGPALREILGGAE